MVHQSLYATPSRLCASHPSELLRHDFLGVLVGELLEDRLHLRPYNHVESEPTAGDTKSAERDALRELEERFDDDVSLTDRREALMAVEMMTEAGLK